MENTTKVVIKTTLCQVAYVYADNSTEIKKISLIGKYSIAGARKHVKTLLNDNIRNIEVLTVEVTNNTYYVDTIQLNNFCLSLWKGCAICTLFFIFITRFYYRFIIRFYYRFIIRFKNIFNRSIKNFIMSTTNVHYTFTVKLIIYVNVLT